MLGLVLSALRARRSQAITLFLLTVLAALGAGAAPWFYGWARDAVAEASIAAAPAEQRVVTASGAVRYDAGAPQLPTDVVRQRASEELDVPGAEAVLGAKLYTNMVAADGAGGSAGLYLSYRDGVCDQLRIEGRCATGDADVMVSRAVAAALDLEIGDEVIFDAFRLPEPVSMTVSAVYEVADVQSPYWAGANLLAGPTGILSTVVEDPAFVSESALFAAAPDGMDVDYHVVLPAAAYIGGQIDLHRLLNDASLALRSASLDVESRAPQLLDQIRDDQRLVGLGVLAAAVQLVVLCWFALYLAVRHTSEDRRPDLGLLRLRGAAGWRVAVHTSLQSAIPMVAGAALGWAVGFLGAAVLAQELAGLAQTTQTEPVLTLQLSLAASGVACLGALAAALAAESRALRTPVVGLLRRVPPRHRGWRADVVELVVVAVAAGGVYQGHADLASGGEPSMLALLAPGLVALAVAVIVARALPWLATVGGAAALRYGRAGIALAALHLARRPGTHRVFAVLAVAVAVLTTTALYAGTASTAWDDRATLAVGADRVLTVQAENSAALLAAVRAADPDGAHAMAVARTASSGYPVLAVDTSRLATVVDLPVAYGIDDPASLADRLHPPAPPAPQVVDGPITVDIRGPVDLGPGFAMSLRLAFTTAAGQVRSVEVGPLREERREYTAEVTGCPDGCRLAYLELVAPGRIEASREGSVEVFAISQGDGPVVGPESLGDVSRWRPHAGIAGFGVIVRAVDRSLTMSLYTGPPSPDERIDARLYVVDAPTPLPVLFAGDGPDSDRRGEERITVLGSQRIPYRAVGTADALPRLGDRGALVDLEYAQRLAGPTGESATLEVWLNRDAPADFATRLAGSGVQVMTEESAATATNRLAEQGPGLALRFQLFAAAVIVLLAAGTIAVTSAVERRPRVAELTALRAQGLPRRAVRVAAFSGTAVLVGGSLAAGLLSALLATIVVTASLPVFADSWELLPLVTGPQAVPLLLALVACLVPLGIAAGASAGRVAREAGSAKATNGGAR